jgi:quercetin dioxygenase-like cupin family protein
MKLSDCVVRVDRLEPYSPDLHAGTVNRRIIGQETVGAKNMEIVLGELDPSGVAEPHSHSGTEQVIYLLKGRIEVEMRGEKMQLEPGDTVYFPPGETHRVVVLGDRPAKLLVTYSPPIQSADTPFEQS